MLHKGIPPCPSSVNTNQIKKTDFSRHLIFVLRLSDFKLSYSSCAARDNSQTAWQRTHCVYKNLCYLPKDDTWYYLHNIADDKQLKLDVCLSPLAGFMRNQIDKKQKRKVFKTLKSIKQENRHATNFANVCADVLLRKIVI